MRKSPSHLISNTIKTDDLIINKIRAEYGGEEKMYAKENNDDKPEDYFDWMVLFKWNNNELNKIIEFECS